MTRHQFYEDFFARFGQERAAKFVLALHRQSVAKKRLSYWQEQMLALCSAETGIKVSSLEEALAAFNVCHVHGAELLRDSVPIQYGTRKCPDLAEVEHAEKTFPFANLFVGGPCWVEASTHSEVVYCPACRTAYRAEHQI